MQFFRVNDKNLQLIEVGYEPIDGVLGVHFRNGQGEHRGVPEDVYLKLRRSPYAYSLYQKIVKGKYPYFKIEDPPEEPNGRERDAETSRDTESEGQNSNSGDAGIYVHSAVSSTQSENDKCHANVPRCLQNSGLNAEGKRRVEMEFWRKEDGLTFTEENHRYEMNGQRVISLTQLLDSSGLVDYSMVNPIVLKDKAAFGTKVHEFTCWHDQNELEPEDLAKLLAHPKYGPRIKGWLQFLDDFKFTTDLNWCETPCAVKLNGMVYACTVDRFGTFGTPEDIGAGKGSFGVVEIKTCCDKEPSHKIQTAGQAAIFRGDGSVQCRRMAVYLLDQPKADGRYYRCEEHTERTDEKIFLSALALTTFRINNGLMKG